MKDFFCAQIIFGFFIFFLVSCQSIPISRKKDWVKQRRGGTIKTIESNPSRFDEELTNLLLGEMEKEGRSGVGLFLFHKEDRLIFAKTFGNIENAIDDVRPFLATELIPVGSSSIWVSTLVLLRLVEKGKLKLSSTTKSVLGWSGKEGRITIRGLLSMTSGLPGYSPDLKCIKDPKQSLATCALKIRQAITKNEIILKKEGEAFSYGPIHLQIAMAMAEKTSGKSWQVLVKNELIRPLGLGKEIFYSHLPGKKSKSGNPSGFDGLSISMKDYLKIMKALVDGKESYLSEKMVDIMLSDQAQSETVLEASPMKVLLRKDYRFGFGNWIECDPGGEKACMERNIRSCPGSFGWYPFIDIKNGYYGILAALEGQDLEKRSSEPTLRSWRVLNKVGSFLQEWQL